MLTFLLAGKLRVHNLLKHSRKKQIGGTGKWCRQHVTAEPEYCYLNDYYILETGNYYYIRSAHFASTNDLQNLAGFEPGILRYVTRRRIHRFLRLVYGADYIN